MTPLAAATAQAYRELAAWIADHSPSKRCPVFGINGAQGSGKSTLASFLRDELRATHGLRAAVVSLDDFYLPRRTRLALAETDHPLFMTRGVPGTHDVALGIATIAALRALDDGASLALPTFSKASDDRLPEAGWPRVYGAFDLILFEGWCLGTPAQDDAALLAPINALEIDEDREGRWRRQVNNALHGPYAEWFALIDHLIFLQVPDFDCVRRWRGQQERETAALAAPGSQRTLSATQLERFVQHYERLTLWALQALPDRAVRQLVLDTEHRARLLPAKRGTPAA